MITLVCFCLKVQEALGECTIHINYSNFILSILCNNRASEKHTSVILIYVFIKKKMTIYVFIKKNMTGKKMTKNCLQKFIHTHE